jgi:alanine racemase
MAMTVVKNLAYLYAAKTVAKAMAPQAAPGVGDGSATEARRLAEMKQRTDQRRRAGFNQTQGAGLSGVTSILGG